MKTQERDEARRLRGEGWSVKEIERHLGVARSSVSNWVRDVELGPEERIRLEHRVRLGPIVAAERKAARARATRLEHQQRGRERLHDSDSSYAAGCALYWAEGSKERNTAVITNADPEVLVYFMGFLRRHFAVTNDRVSLRCNLFADHVERQREIEQFWLDRLGLPAACLRRSIVNRYSKYSQKKRTNRLPYGTARLVLNSTEIVQTIYGSIQELGGFDQPAWLD